MNNKHMFIYIPCTVHVHIQYMYNCTLVLAYTVNVQCNDTTRVMNLYPGTCTGSLVHVHVKCTCKMYMYNYSQCITQ